MSFTEMQALVTDIRIAERSKKKKGRAGRDTATSVVPVVLEAGPLACERPLWRQCWDWSHQYSTAKAIIRVHFF